jgi:hypothetical protein
MTDLIPTNGIHITQADYPKGYYVAKYDAKGFTTDPRWFPTLVAATAYASKLS